MARYVLVGNSIAANAAAARIHSLDPAGDITFVTDEPVPYYSRCALMYYAMDHCSRRDICIADDEHYRRLNATVVYDRAVGLDASAHRLDLADGGSLAYDKLLLACGSTPRRLGLDSEGATGITDFTTLRHAETVITEARAARHAVVVGGGLIGAEVVEVLRAARVKTDYLLRGADFYSASCSHAQSEIIVDHFRRHGVGMFLGSEVAGFETDASGHVRTAIDNHGISHPADLVVRAIGVEPNVAWLSGSGVQTGRGVIVGPDLGTSAPDLWAAGDCAELHVPGRDRPIVQALWYTAEAQGWVAGENMAGGEVGYDVRVSYTSAMFLDLDFCSYDLVSAAPDKTAAADLTSPNGVDCLRLRHRDGRVTGASFLGRALTKEDLEHMVEGGMSPSDALEATARVFGPRRSDRAPRNRIAPRARLSRRAPYWPFGSGKTWRN